MHLKTTIIDADILKHEGKGAIFLRQFLMFWEQGVLEISKQKKISKSR